MRIWGTTGLSVWPQEGACKHHRVQLLALPRTNPRIHTMCLSVLGKQLMSLSGCSLWSLTDCRLRDAPNNWRKVVVLSICKKGKKEGLEYCSFVSHYPIENNGVRILLGVKKVFGSFSQGKLCLIHGIAFCNEMRSSAVSQCLKSWLPRAWWYSWVTVGGWGIMVISWNTTGYKEGNVWFESTSALEQPRVVMKYLFASLTGLNLEQSGRLN